MSLFITTDQVLIHIRGLKAAEKTQYRKIFTKFAFIERHFNPRTLHTAESCILFYRMLYTAQSCIPFYRMLHIAQSCLSVYRMLTLQKKSFHT